MGSKKTIDLELDLKAEAADCGNMMSCYRAAKCDGRRCLEEKGFWVGESCVLNSEEVNELAFQIRILKEFCGGGMKVVAELCGDPRAAGALNAICKGRQPRVGEEMRDLVEHGMDVMHSLVNEVDLALMAV